MPLESQSANPRRWSESARCALERVARRIARLPRWVQIGGAAALLLVMILPWLVSPIVLAKARARAEKAGVKLTIERATLGWGRISLWGVDVRIPEVQDVDVHLDRVSVAFGPSLQVSSVTVYGGQVSVREPLAVLSRQLQKWRGERSGGGSGSGVSYVARGLGLSFRNPGYGIDSARIWGAGWQRTAASNDISMDLVRVSLRGANADIQGIRARVGKQGKKLRLEGFSAESVRGELALDELTGDRPGAQREPDTDDSPANQDPGLRRALKAHAAFARLAELAREVLPEKSHVDLAGVHLRLHRLGESLNLGPARFRAARDVDVAHFSLTPAAEAQSPLTLGLELPLTVGEVKVELAGGPVKLSALGIQEGDWGLQRVNRGEVSGKGVVVLSADGQRLRFSGEGRVREVSLQHRALAAAPVSGIELGFHGSGELSLDGSSVRLADSELELGKVRVLLRGELERDGARERATAVGTVPLVACQDALDSVPQGLAPLLAGMRMTGTFGFSGDIGFDTQKIDAMRAQWQVVNDCRVVATSSAVAPARFAAPWVREVKAADGRSVNLETGPGTPHWVPYRSISENVETAVLVCEDGAFFRHHGFDQEAIRNSIRENIRSKRFVRGASTISMQLAKNLYLGREKTLGRKLQEAVLTELLEQELSKEQLMELYLNVIEFAPGIYGVGPAAQYYFNTVPARLSLGQALYMASVLPNPKLQHFGPDGQVSAGWMNYLRKLMHIAHKIRRISDEELADALLEQVTFGVPYSPRVPPDEPAIFHDEAQFGPAPNAPAAD